MGERSQRQGLSRLVCIRKSPEPAYRLILVSLHPTLQVRPLSLGQNARDLLKYIDVREHKICR